MVVPSAGVSGELLGLRLCSVLVWVLYGQGPDPLLVAGCMSAGCLLGAWWAGLAMGLCCPPRLGRRLWAIQVGCASVMTLTRMGDCQVLSQSALWQVCGVISIFWMGTCGQKDKGQPQFSASKL